MRLAESKMASAAKTILESEPQIPVIMVELIGIEPTTS